MNRRRAVAQRWIRAWYHIKLAGPIATLRRRQLHLRTLSGWRRSGSAVTSTYAARRCSSRNAGRACQGRPKTHLLRRSKMHTPSRGAARFQEARSAPLRRLWDRLIRARGRWLSVARQSPAEAHETAAVASVGSILPLVNKR